MIVIIQFNEYFDDLESKTSIIQDLYCIGFFITFIFFFKENEIFSISI